MARSEGFLAAGFLFRCVIAWMEIGLRDDERDISGGAGSRQEEMPARDWR